MRIIKYDTYGNKTELVGVNKEKLQIAASLFKWSIIGGITITIIVSAGLVGVVTLGAFVTFGIIIKEGLR